MKKKMLLGSLSLLLAVSLLAIGCAPEAAPPPPGEEEEAPPAEPAEEVFNWRFQSHHGPTTFSSRVMHKNLIKRIEEMSDGRIKIEHYFGGELVASTDLIPALEHNTVQLAFTSGTLYKGDIPTGWLAGCSLPPFYWDNYFEMSELFHQLGLDELQRESFAEHGVYFLNTCGAGNVYFWSDRPIYGVDDLKGFKVRFFGGLNEVMEALGASPVYLPHEETYMAISQGTLNGGGTEFEIYEALSLYEVAPYFIGPAWLHPGEMALMTSMDAWNALPDDLKEIVRTACLLNSHETAVMMEAYRAEMFKKFDDWGVTYIEWGPEDVAKGYAESLKLLDKIETEIGPLDPRVAEGVEIVRNYAKLRGR